MLDRHNKNMQLQIAIIEKLSLKPTKLDLKSTYHIFHPLKLVWQNNTCSYRHKSPHLKQFKIIYVWTFRGCLVDKLQHMFSVFKRYYTHFHALFHPHVFPHMFSNTCTKLLLIYLNLHRIHLNDNQEGLVPLSIPFPESECPAEKVQS